eukprot:Amastigsp_a184070_18.p2 type:complete len:150 gc:universal Amastigsp_a184070_18:344-793(+)
MSVSPFCLRSRTRNAGNSFNELCSGICAMSLQAKMSSSSCGAEPSGGISDRQFAERLSVTRFLNMASAPGAMLWIWFAPKLSSSMQSRASRGSVASGSAATSRSFCMERSSTRGRSLRARNVATIAEYTAALTCATLPRPPDVDATRSP